MRQIYLGHINLFMVSVLLGTERRIFIGTEEEVQNMIKIAQATVMQDEND